MIIIINDWICDGNCVWNWLKCYEGWIHELPCMHKGTFNLPLCTVFHYGCPPREDKTHLGPHDIRQENMGAGVWGRDERQRMILTQQWKCGREGYWNKKKTPSLCIRQSGNLGSHAERAPQQCIT